MLLDTFLYFSTPYLAVLDESYHSNGRDDAIFILGAQCEFDIRLQPRLANPVGHSGRQRFDIPV
jgi:hypothetical protein